MTQAIVDMLVKGGMTVAEACEAVEFDNGRADEAYIDYNAENARDEELAQYVIDFATIKAMDKDARRALRRTLDEALNRYWNDYDAWDVIYPTYETLGYIEDEEYREANYATFRAYELRMGEPDFDWGMYSDWHKDMFGYRPHYEVIPQTEEEREALFHKFHTERWY